MTKFNSSSQNGIFLIQDNLDTKNYANTIDTFKSYFFFRLFFI